MSPGTVITELKGSMADLTDEEDKELARAGVRNENGVRRDFSVIHSKQMKKNHLFLGPARFVNVSNFGGQAVFGSPCNFFPAMFNFLLFYPHPLSLSLPLASIFQ